jgi:D-amino-acid oxidase
MIDRRTALQTTGWGLLGLTGAPALAQIAFAPRIPIAPINARPDRLMRVTVCLRPFRAAGPRIELERIAGRQVIHHYGHGGSGWSLSWGSAMQAVPLALQAGAREVAVVGAGAIGLTTAITAQRLGLKVVIYAQDRFPDVRSARATGTWSPHSRVAMDGAVDAGFAARWEVMARRSWAMHQAYLGRAGMPVEFLDRYVLLDAAPSGGAGGGVHKDIITLPDGRTDTFVNYEERLADISPRNETLGPDQHPFPVAVARRSLAMNFNVNALAATLEQEFLAAGGRFEPMTLTSPRDFARIKERVIFNCTGYGARALLADTSIIPVRGQIGWLPPQPEVRYGFYYRDVAVVSRPDGIVVQDIGRDEGFGFNDANEAPDLVAARATVERIASLFRPRAA